MDCFDNSAFEFGVAIFGRYTFSELVISPCFLQPPLPPRAHGGGGGGPHGAGALGPSAGGPPNNVDGATYGNRNIV